MHHPTNHLPRTKYKKQQRYVTQLTFKTYTCHRDCQTTTQAPHTHRNWFHCSRSDSIRVHTASLTRLALLLSLSKVRVLYYIRVFEPTGRWVWGAWWVVTMGVQVALLTPQTRFVMALPAPCMDAWRCRCVCRSQPGHDDLTPTDVSCCSGKEVQTTPCQHVEAPHPAVPKRAAGGGCAGAGRAVLQGCQEEFQEEAEQACQESSGQHGTAVHRGCRGRQQSQLDSRQGQGYCCQADHNK